ncbi:membrane protease YdiL (CAAX protease family) [Lachnospiraceae bacterium PF1-22]|uniref:CPBP family intramembrane glutamic endopeptidase n=1 Tax=Ohessyouella blattaphilus TaxID=2949333 RepID=UPI002560013A|nr:CPBP family intramembrane metalloprotease [Lachnospiraceae bacterium OttesenSCG-928-J05]
MKKRAFSTIGIALLVATLALQGFAGTVTAIIAFITTLNSSGGDVMNATLEITMKLNTLLSVLGECIALLIFRVMTKGVIGVTAPKEKMSTRSLYLLGVACYGTSILLATFGGALNQFLQKLLKGSEAVGETTQIVSTMLDKTPLFLTILTVGILGPIIEELLFRKALIDKLRPFGYTTSILLSGLLFGAFHMNFEQFFYAAFIGVLLGAIYYKTGDIKYSIIIHIVFNSFNIFVSQAATLNETAVTIIQNVFVLIGLLFFLIMGIKYLRQRPQEESVPVTKKEIFINGGMLAYLICCLLGMIGTGLIL